VQNGLLIEEHATHDGVQDGLLIEEHARHERASRNQHRNRTRRTVHHNVQVTDDSQRPAQHSLFWFAIAIAVAVVLVDQLTKLWAVTTLSLDSSVPVIGDFIRFQLIYNSGAAFSMGTNSTWVFTIIAAAAVIVIGWYAWRVESKLWMLALGLLLGGAATHLGDRLFRPPAFGQGHVVDFIGYGNFFIGNVADIVLFCGAVMLVILALTGVRMRSTADES
jgi:signal peptidase II